MGEKIVELRSLMIALLLLFSGFTYLSLIAESGSFPDLNEIDALGVPDQKVSPPFSNSNFSVEIYPRIYSNGGTEDNFKMIPPGSFVTFDLTVELNGSGVPETQREKIFVRINLSTLPSGWNAWLDTPPDRGNDNPDYVQLASNETVEVMLKVWSPWVGDNGDMARITVDAFCESNPNKNDKIDFLAVLNLFHNFEIFFLKTIDQDPLSELVNKKWDKINPGAEGLYTISINNKGNLNDTYDLSLSTPSRKVGWDWYFVETGTLNASVTLTAQSLADVFGGISGQTFTVAVTVPINATANTVVPVVLKGHSHNLDRPSADKKDELYIVVGTASNLSLSVDQPYLYTYPNGTHHINLILENTGNKDVMMVMLSVSGKVSGYDIKFPEEPIPVYQGQSKIIPVRIRMPYWFGQMREGTIFNCTFIGNAGGGPDVSDSATITFEVVQVRYLDHKLVLPEDLDHKPGENFTGTLKVHSFSNFEDEIYIYSKDQDIPVEIGLFNDIWDPIGVFPLDMDESFHINIKVDIPEDALAGECPVTIILDPIINDPIEITFSVNITFIGELEMELVDGRIYVKEDIPVNEVMTHKLKITNNGNGDDLVMLSMGRLFYENPMVKVPLNRGWKASFYGVTMTNLAHKKEIRMTYSELRDLGWLEQDAYYRLSSAGDYPSNYHELQFRIGTGETWYVDLAIWADTEDGSSLVDDTTLQIIGRSIDISILEKISFELNVNYPDLMFGETFQFFNSKGVPVEEPFSEGDYTLLFTVNNFGNSSSPATHLITIIDGEKMIRSDIGPLEPGSGREITVSFTLVEGSLSIWIEIDPLNNVHELNDQIVDDGQYDNNQKTIQVEIDGEKDTLPIAVIAMGLTISILAVAGLLFVLLFIWRKPPASSGEE